MEQLASLNDMVVRFANTNGTGSASANSMFAKAIYRMGIPVSAKNIFPSNIQGMPTWYEVRISEKGYLGRRGNGCELVVAMNVQSLPEDIDTVLPGGYLLFDSTRPLEHSMKRPDIHWLGIPIADICRAEYSDPRQRQLFKNVIYVGALAALLAIDFDILKSLVADQFKGKEKLITPNVFALELGFRYAQKHFECPLPIRVEARDLVGERIMMEGNTALGLGAVYGGATVAGWYPITPSTSVVEQFDQYCQRLRIEPATGKKNFAIVQAEDELAALGIVIGAAWNGARAFTATSGPGISLMSEFLGLAYFAEVPLVLVDVQRAGPSTGMPTRTQQSDIMACALASHGDTRHILLFPGTPAECFSMMAQAFDLAERWQTPVIVMSDLDLGMNNHLSDPLVWDDEHQFDRGKVLSAEQLDEMETFGRYLDADGDGICYRTLPGTHSSKGAFFTRGTSRNEFAAYTENGDEYVANMRRLNRKFANASHHLPRCDSQRQNKKGAIGLIYLGTTDAVIPEARAALAARGVVCNVLRIRAFPFTPDVTEFIRHHQQIFVIEQNRDGQLRSLLSLDLELDPNDLKSVRHFDGHPITAQTIVQQISQVLGVTETKEGVA